MPLGNEAMNMAASERLHDEIHYDRIVGALYRSNLRQRLDDRRTAYVDVQYQAGRATGFSAFLYQVPHRLQENARCCRLQHATASSFACSSQQRSQQFNPADAGTRRYMVIESACG